MTGGSIPLLCLQGPFPIWNQSVVPCPVLTVASWPAYRFLKRQVRWSSIPISFRIFHSWLWSTQSKAFGIVNKAEIDVFLELSGFFDDPADVGNLISGCSAFCKTTLSWCCFRYLVFNICRVHHCEMPDWKKHKLESRLQGEISITSDTQMTPPWWQKNKN